MFEGVIGIFMKNLRIVGPVDLKCAAQLVESVVQRRSVKKLFLEISQNSSENTCARVSFLIGLQLYSCEFCEISKSIFLHRTPLVAASELVQY